MNILVVDDDIVFLDKMKKNLSIDRHSVTTAQSGEEALEILDNTSFDLIITDLQMKKISGMEFIRELRSKKNETITIVLTGYGSINSAVEAMKLGAYDYLLKPLRLPELRNKIAEVEKEFQLRNEFRVPEMAPRTTILSDLGTGEYDPPFLVLSTRDSSDIIKNLDLVSISAVSVSNVQEEGKISPTKLHQLKNTIADFVNNQDTGTIIFDGIQDILTAHGWKNFKQFIKYLQDKVISANYTMLFLIRDDTDNEQYDQIMLHDALSMLSVQTFDTIVEIISHPIRKAIITLLKTRETAKFTKIAEELNIESTATLTFHIKKLVQEQVLTKEENTYRLTPRGEFLDDIIFSLEKAGLIYPGSHVKVLEYKSS